MKYSLLLKPALAGASILVAGLHTLQAQQRLQASATSLTAAESKEVLARVKEYSPVTLDTRALAATIAAEGKPVAQVNLAFNDKSVWQLTLEPNELRAATYQSVVTTDKGIEQLPYTPCQTYKGFADGDPNQSVRLSVNEKSIQGYIKHQGEFWCIEPLSTFSNKASGDKYILFKSTAIVAGGGLFCGVTAAQEQQYLQLHSTDDMSVGQRSCIGKEAEIALDADYEYFQRYGNNASQNILNILNQVEGIYESTLQLHFRVTYQNVWTTANDPYTVAGEGSTVQELKNYWNANRTFVQRDLVHLFSAKNYGGLYGEVSGIGVVCSSPSNSYGFTVDRTGAFLTTAHEIGHNFAGLHSDGQNCGSSSASIMCQGEKSLYFSSNEISRIGGYINSNSSCISPPTPVASGPDIVCTNEVFTLQNAPAGTSVSWTASGNLLPTSGTGSTASVTANGDGEGYVDFTLSGFCTATVRKNTQVGPFPITGNFHSSTNPNNQTTPLQGANYVPTGNVTIQVSAGAGNTYSFSSQYPTTTIYQSPPAGSNVATFYVGPSGTANERVQINVTATGPGVCGSATSTFWFFVPRTYFTVTPNPATSELKIQAKETDLGSEVKALPSVGATRILSSSTARFETALYNSQGTLVKTDFSQRGQVKIDVLSLPNGLYTLRVGSGKDAYSERIQIAH